VEREDIAAVVETSVLFDNMRQAIFRSGRMAHHGQVLQGREGCKPFTGLEGTPVKEKL
jgi:hypothetical protein